MTISLSLLVMTAVVTIVTLGRAQDATSTATAEARVYEKGVLPQNYTKTSSPLPYSGNFVNSSWTGDEASLWRLHLVFQLVKRPKLKAQQVQVILDAISLSSSEFFTTSNDTLTQKVKADDALQALRRRALAAFSRNEVADLFANIAGRKADEDILQKYYDVSALPLKQRKATFRNASSNDQSDLWRTHLALFLIKRPELNQWQKEIILTAMSLATPEYFQVRANNPGWKTKVRAPLRALEDQIMVAFSLKDGAKIFATLGDDAEAAIRTPTRPSWVLNNINYRQLSESGPYTGQTDRVAGQDMFAGGPCECSTDCDWCPIASYCGGTTCSPTPSGCGTLWSYPCNGASCR